MLVRKRGLIKFERVATTLVKGGGSKRFRREDNSSIIGWLSGHVTYRNRRHFKRGTWQRQINRHARRNVKREKKRERKESFLIRHRQNDRSFNAS